MDFLDTYYGKSIAVCLNNVALYEKIYREIFLFINILY